MKAHYSIGGMVHPHLPQTYYLIARNNIIDIDRKS